MFKDFHDKYKCIFIHVPKVAGSSIERVIYQTDKWLVGHVKASDYTKFDKDKFDSYFSFGFVRNPYDRVVSAYHYLKNDSPDPCDIKWGRLHINNLTFEEFILSLQDEEFKEEILSKNHFSFQYKYLCDKNMNILVNFIGKFEKLDNDFKKILNILRRKDSLVHINKSKHLNYRDYYNSQTYKIIREIYRDDFEIFDYDLEDKKYFNIPQNIYLNNLESKILIKNINLDSLRLKKSFQIQNLNQTIETKNKTIQENLSQINNLNQTIETKNKTIQENLSQINNLNQTIETKNKTIQENLSQINNLNQTIETKNKTIQNKDDLLNFQAQYGTAKSRIQNQLSYKLGQTMIVNSKSFLGCLLMPVILLGIVISHKQEQKIYKQKIEKDPSLKLPSLEQYPDYREAIKLKNHLSYKLGKELVKANKIWYKGGYFQFLYFIKKLKV
ncbi:sulfotransferase family 2 domain-containing protein [Campylobacter coli]|uniref:sulfotransferase family 2 domain-containing protein n=1 Tax=Campylobacter coli TaxID=195 RepID=UPI0012803A01|nr:sulfotransferase family 2 domain-containing protein [Campylobacter coli]EAJ6217733.1 alpha-2,3-sialyltransferase [Campylobacter coli]EAL2778115.1 alpha-2,3-sialyltransferase [Campylobacter coli]EAL4303106.1 alpha-2,3-sialyltransferase [Campylobacter coli]EIV0437228.1 sulfotransferase family 2 domain-containing protein [Campylobacter coli]EKG4698361.1 sulfotransferase family 2 domain-containing protein [Campylobacter coli]